MHPTHLSEAQHRYWLLDQLNPDKPLVNLPLALRLHGALDAPALSWAVTEVGRRHDALRSEVLVYNDEPYQVIKSLDLRLSAEDYSALPQAEREWLVERRLREEIVCPFDHSRAPLIRFFLFREAPEQHVLLIVTSQVVVDQWSLDVLLRDLGRLYAARAHDRELPSRPHVRFTELARRQPLTLERPEHVQNLEWWRQRLSGMPATLALPLDHPRPRVPSYAAHRTCLELAGDELRALRAWCEASGLPPRSVALAALELVLARYGGQQDFGIGLLAEARHDEAAARLVGVFMGATVLRSDVPQASTFAELAGRVHEHCQSGLEHADVSLQKLLQLVAPLREQAPRGLFQITFASETVSAGPLSFDGLRVERLGAFTGFAHGELGFGLRDDGQALTLSVDAACDLFDSDTAGRLCRSWQRVLTAVPEHAAQPLASMPVIGVADEGYLLDALNDTRAPWDERALVHRLFEAQVDERPEAVALIFEEQAITFRELDVRANRLAHALVARGVEMDTLVGLSLRRTPELVIAMLAILKAGGAYVPLDPDYPAERIEYVLADSGAKVLITSADVAARLTGCPTCVLVDAEADAIEELPNERLRRAERPEQLAYVIYTSGSTGKPKGVMVEHRNAVSFFAGMESAIGLDDHGTWLAATSISFDISVLEILGSLTHGRRVVLLGEAVLGQVEDPRYTIAAQIARHGVTHFQCTPSQVRILLMDEAGRGALASLEQLLLGGEALPQELADELGGLLRGKLVNLYGPTETTVWSTVSVVERGRRVSIGRPIKNTCLFVLDAAQQPVLPGAVGELYIGGPGVTRGYHGRPELTAERFVTNRLRPALGERLYRTGDLVRYAPDGSLVYLGRNDHQVKLRGHRIELGEIESAIRKESGVRDAVVVARGDGSDKRLVAYLVADDAFAGDDALRAALRAALPEFMVPAAIVHLDALPLTPNGKVDRGALPEPAASNLAPAEYLEPRTELQRKLCEVWQRALGVPRVGRSDNFFDLGGHSLLAVKISNEVEKTFGARLPLSTLFECPTLEAFAARLAALTNPTQGPSAAPGWTTLVPIQTHGTLPPLFCVAGLGGNPMNLRHVAAALGDEQPFFGLQMRGVDGQLAPHTDVRAMADEFLADIRSQQPRGPYYLAGYSFGGLVALEMAQLLRQSGERVPLLVLFDTTNPELPDWTLKERVDAHLANLRERGAAYFANRLFARVRAEIVRRRRKLYAQLAKLNQFEYRNEAVWEASERAMARYKPARYDGPVLLLQADWRLSAGDGIGLRPHPTNGWGELFPQLDIAEIPSSHIDVVSEQAAPLAAEALARALAAARERAQHQRSQSSPASSDPKSGPRSNRLGRVA